MTRPSSGPGQCCSAALAIAAEALPAPTTMVRPLGGSGRCWGTMFSGRATSIAALNMALSRSCGDLVTASLLSSQAVSVRGPGAELEGNRNAAGCGHAQRRHSDFGAQHRLDRYGAESFLSH